MFGRELADLPKAHLHLHLEGAMRPTTLDDLAARYGVPAPDVGARGSFTDFVRIYFAACAVIRRPDDLKRLVFEVVEDAVGDGAVWIEPTVYLPIHAGLAGGDQAALELLLRYAADAADQTGAGVGYLVAADRTRPPTEAEAQARIAAAYAGRGVVAFGLANDEAGHPPEPFAAAFAIAREAGLIPAPHAGELAGPESVRGALDALGARRLQHGVRAVEDPELVARLAGDGVCLDVCPSSNVALGVFADLSSHPLPVLLEAGVRCSLNADDPLMFGSGLLDEYRLAGEQMGLDAHRLAEVARASLLASGAPTPLQAAALNGIDDWLEGAPEEPPPAKSR